MRNRCVNALCCAICTVMGIIILFYCHSMADGPVLEARCNISAYELLSSISSGQKFIMVDVRAVNEFDRYHIPGSLNIPLHEIGHKSFLKSHNILIINQGGELSRLESTCDELRQNEFDHIYILSGGLAAWRDAGGEITGDYFAIDGIDEIKPSHCYADLKHGRWIVVAAGIGDAASILFQHDAVQVSCSKQVEKCAESIAESVNKIRVSQYDKPVLVVTEAGNYQELKKNLRAAGVENAFYLKGGIRAYKKFLENARLINQSKHQEVRPCGSCP